MALTSPHPPPPKRKNTYIFSNVSCVIVIDNRLITSRPCPPPLYAYGYIDYLDYKGLINAPEYGLCALFITKNLKNLMVTAFLRLCYI